MIEVKGKSDDELAEIAFNLAERYVIAIERQAAASEAVTEFAKVQCARMQEQLDELR